jgi:quercetin 2,3-dioxygenase
MQTRRVRKVVKSHATTEGAGVKLHRAIGLGSPEEYDPFLLLDDFRSDTPADYRAGFPWHPHRGMETITYVLRGEVEHQDSLGNRGVIAPGDLQWMSAGSGIIHQEMPKGDAAGRMHGFQLWANLPAASKMSEPRYRGIVSSDIPEVKDAGGAVVKVIAGEVNGVRGPVRDVATNPEYLDVTEPLRFLLVSGMPIREPIAWRGPIVMNTQAELRTAFEELDRGTFIKHPRRST